MIAYYLRANAFDGDEDHQEVTRELNATHHDCPTCDHHRYATEVYSLEIHLMYPIDQTGYGYPPTDEELIDFIMTNLGDEALSPFGGDDWWIERVGVPDYFREVTTS